MRPGAGYYDYVEDGVKIDMQLPQRLSRAAKARTEPWLAASLRRLRSGTTALAKLGACPSLIRAGVQLRCPISEHIRRRGRVSNAPRLAIGRPSFWQDKEKKKLEERGGAGIVSQRTFGGSNGSECWERGRREGRITWNDVPTRWWPRIPSPADMVFWRIASFSSLHQTTRRPAN